jgi:hypothetical protein
MTHIDSPHHPIAIEEQFDTPCHTQIIGFGETAKTIVTLAYRDPDLDCLNNNTTINATPFDTPSKTHTASQKTDRAPAPLSYTAQGVLTVNNALDLNKAETVFVMRTARRMALIVDMGRQNAVLAAQSYLSMLPPNQAQLLVVALLPWTLSEEHPDAHHHLKKFRQIESSNVLMKLYTIDLSMRFEAECRAHTNRRSVEDFYPGIAQEVHTQVAIWTQFLRGNVVNYHSRFTSVEKPPHSADARSADARSADISETTTNLDRHWNNYLHFTQPNDPSVSHASIIGISDLGNMILHEGFSDPDPQLTRIGIHTHAHDFERHPDHYEKTILIGGNLHKVNLPSIDQELEQIYAARQELLPLLEAEGSIVMIADLGDHISIATLRFFLRHLNQIQKPMLVVAILPSKAIPILRSIAESGLETLRAAEMNSMMLKVVELDHEVLSQEINQQMKPEKVSFIRYLKEVARHVRPIVESWLRR